MVGVLNGKKGKAFASGFVVAFLLCGVFGGLVAESFAVTYSNFILDKEIGCTSDYSGFPVENANDGDASSRWLNDGAGGNDTLYVDAGALYYAYNVSVKWNTGNSLNSSLYRSFDNVSWIHVVTWLGAGVEGLTESQAFNEVQGRYFKLEMGVSPDYIALYEWRVYGYVVDTSDVEQSKWLGVGVSVFLIGLSVLLALKGKSWAVCFLFGLSLVGYLGWIFANGTVEFFGGWLDFMVLVGAVLVLVKGAVLVRASGV